MVDSPIIAPDPANYLDPRRLRQGKFPRRDRARPGIYRVLRKCLGGI